MAEKHKDEDRDTLIAFIVFGVVLILLLLWLFGGFAYQNAQPDTTTSDSGIPGGDSYSPLTATMPGDATPYNYNVAPFNPDPPILNTTYNNGTGNSANDNCSCSGGGAAAFGSQCSTIAGGGVTTNQFLTLVGLGG